MPDLFITVPETTLPSGIVVPSFQFGQFLASKGPDGKLAITAEGTPWTNITFADAKKACEAAGYQQVTERQWSALGHNVASVDANWTKGKVGEGKLFRGLRLGTVSSAQPGTFESPNPKERRFLTLTNGERVCDINGNAYQWSEDDIQGDENGLVASAFAENSPSLYAPFPSMKKGMGWRPDAGTDWSGSALVRGGCWRSESAAGVFRLSGGWPGGAGDSVGFRCTKPIGL